MELVNKGIDNALVAKVPIQTIAGDDAVAFVRDHLANLEYLKRTNSPEVNELVYSGIAGQIVKKIEPHTESDTIALLVQFLIGVGSIFGRSVNFLIEGSPHYTNLFAILVGATGNGRKGTSWKQIRRILELIDTAWVKNNVMGGLGSGEVIVDKISDTNTEKFQAFSLQAPPPVNVARNINDKRLMIQEEEFSSLLKVGARDGSIISQTLRKAWDSEKIENQNKKNPLWCEKPHISLIGHITKEELVKYFSRTEAASGFGNRFLFFEVKQSKRLPHGGDIQTVNFDSEIQYLKKVIDFAKQNYTLKESAESHHAWEKIYEQVTKERHGLLAAMCNRSAPIIRRLSLIYATLDCSRTIEVSHTLSALALWAKSESSVERIFKNYLSDPIADDIFDFISENESGVTRTQIRNHFKRNARRNDIQMGLDSLEEAKLISKEIIQPGAKGGKPTEKWHLKRFGR
jgi:hypothetical protein